MVLSKNVGVAKVRERVYNLWAMNTQLLFGILVGLVVAFVVYNFSKRKQANDEDLASILDKKIPLIASTVKDQLQAEKQDIQTDLKNKKEVFEDLVKRVTEMVKDHNKQLSDNQKDTVGTFRALKQQLESHEKITEQLSVTADGLKKVLSNNQLRGQFGEQVAEDLLKMSGFVNGVDYQSNKNQKNSETRPDFTILLPDGVKINVDVKFPYSNLQKFSETQNQDFIKAFKQDVKEKIKQCTTRDYINAADNTVDFVILFIPNEMIFSFIYEQMNDVWTEAMRQKVVLAGPFSFTAVLRLIRQSYDTFRYQKNVQKIISQIKTFEIEFQKYNDEFEKIGDRIMSLTQQYETVNTTRTKQLMRSVDKIRLEESTAPLLEADTNKS